MQRYSTMTIMSLKPLVYKHLDHDKVSLYIINYVPTKYMTYHAPLHDKVRPTHNEVSPPRAFECAVTLTTVESPIVDPPK